MEDKALMRAVFFDRDDTLIHDVPYNPDPSKVKLLPDALASLQKLQIVGFLLFIVTNQSGVGRGLITAEDVERVNQEVLRQLKGLIKQVYTSHDAPGMNAKTRKPSPALLFQARHEYRIDLEHSFMVGDKLSDIECAVNAGCRSVLLPNRHENAQKRSLAEAKATYIAENLTEATDWILRQ